MLDTLQKMSGTTHRAFINSKTITRDTERIWMQNEGKTSYTMSVQEVPVISYNDMAFISPRNSIVFRAGDSPIWNRNETILPMSWRLLQNTIKQPGHTYTFQTIPTLSSAREFDRRKNQPDFGRMVDKRMAQAMAAENAKSAYQSIYGYSEWDIEQLDPDLYAAEIMEVINTSLTEAVDDGDSTDDYIDACIEEQESVRNLAEDNPEQARATAEAAERQKNEDKKRFARKILARSDLAPNGIPNHSLDREIVKAFIEVKGDMAQDRVNFAFNGDSLCSPTGVDYIVKNSPTDDLNKINKAAKDKNSAVFAEGDIDPNDVKLIGTYTVTDEFIVWLARQENWRSFAKGRFDDEMARLLATD